MASVGRYWDIPPQNGGECSVFRGVFLNVNWDRVRDPGYCCSVVPFARPRPVARCLSCVHVVCQLLSSLFLVVNIRFYLSDLCCCFVQ